MGATYVSWNRHAADALAKKSLPIRTRSVSADPKSDIGMVEMTAGAMAELVFVSDWQVVDKDSPAKDKRGYQRPLTASRLSDIGDYVKESKDGRHLFPPVVLSVRHVAPDEREEFLHLLRGGNIEGIHARWGGNTVCAVDGQHRMGGALDAAITGDDEVANIYYSCVFYFGMTYITEANWFATINRTAKPVPRSLVEWTKVDITEAGSVDIEQSVRVVAQRLATEGAWTDQVNFGGGRILGRHITYEGLRRSTADMFGGTSPTSTQFGWYSDPYAFANRFWTAVATMWPDAWEADPKADKRYRLKELVGVASLAKACASMARYGHGMGLTGKKLEDYIIERLERAHTFRWLKSDNPTLTDVSDIGPGFGGQGPLAERLYQRTEKAA